MLESSRRPNTSSVTWLLPAALLLHCPPQPFIFKLVLIYFFERQKERDPISSFTPPDACNRRDWSALKPGALSSIQDSHLSHQCCLPRSARTQRSRWSCKWTPALEGWVRGCINRSLLGLWAGHSGYFSCPDLLMASYLFFSVAVKSSHYGSMKHTSMYVILCDTLRIVWYGIHTTQLQKQNQKQPLAAALLGSACLPPSHLPTPRGSTALKSV